MANYISGGQKKSKIFKKRETKLIHAIKNKYSSDKIAKAVEELREAKLQAYKVQPRSREANKEKWISYTVDELISIYEKKIS